MLIILQRCFLRAPPVDQAEGRTLRILQVFCCLFCLSRYCFEVHWSVLKCIFVLRCSHCWHVCCTTRYHLRDVIVGKIYFLLVRIKIRHMEIQIIKRESTGSGMKQLQRFCNVVMSFFSYSTCIYCECMYCLVSICIGNISCSNLS